MNVIRTILTIVVRVWTLPNTILGCALGLIALASGGRMQWRRGCIEFYGGWLAAILRRMPTGNGAAAMTLGHTIVGQNLESLDACRDHEHVHVAQYERWGPFFIPAYLACSAVLWLRRRDPYLDNPFEVQAYNCDHGGSSFHSMD